MCDPLVVRVLGVGARIEPLIHPKPGAVTRLHRHPDKDVVTYMISSIPLDLALSKTCRQASTDCNGSMASGMKAYRDAYEKLIPRRVNTSLGTLLLLLPMSMAHGVTGLRDPWGLARVSSSLVARCTGRDEAVEYYGLLKLFRPSHMGRYTGPLPDIDEGVPDNFMVILRANSWDLVHREILSGYPLTLEALSIMVEARGGLEDRSLKALLHLLSRYGDTLIARKYGMSAFKKARAEAIHALMYAERVGLRAAIEYLDSLWRPRGWNPGAVLDIIAASISMYVLYMLVEGRDPSL